MGKINPPNKTPKSIRSLLNRIEARDDRIEEMENAVRRAIKALNSERHAAQGEHPVARDLQLALDLGYIED